ncbi:MAG: fused MFS/spermidine synthase [Gemmatirosa sp.]
MSVAVPPRAEPSRAAAVTALFAFGIAANAALLFAVEPLVSRQLLPLLGGTPSVWNSCLMTFQALLLVGYLYAHFVARRFAPRGQAVVHLALFGLSLLALPVAVRAAAGAPPESWGPSAWVVRLLLGAVGAPFLVLSAGAPLLQRWYAAWRAHAAPDHAGDDAATYALYAASNAGSLVALLGYPLLIEPNLGLGAQSRWWSVAYAMLGALLLGCAAVVARRVARGPITVDAATLDAPRADASSDASGAASTAVPTHARRAHWTLLAFVPSALLLAVTRYLTTDVAPVPLLWVVPLAVYLLTFIVAFAPGLRPPTALLDRAMTSALPVLAILVVLGANSPLGVVATAHLAAFGIAALWCHQMLAESRPDVAHLTEFYLWISFGGLLGGVFNALVAPAAFNGLAEYPISVALAAVARALVPMPAAPAPVPTTTRLGARLQEIAGLVGASTTPRPGLLHVALCRVVAPLVVAELAYVAASKLSIIPLPAEINVVALFGGAAALLCLLLRSDRTAFALAVAALLVGGAIGQRARQASVLLRARSFYGAYTVRESSPLHYLQHGTTLHGTQDRSPSRRTTPLSYYHREGPLGVLLTTAPRLAPTAPPRRVAAVGLGTGTVACHGREGERWTFYEIDPLMERIARDPALFTYLRDCPPSVDVVIGDARLQLATARAGTFDLILLDAFSSDAIPTHLLTREALATYLRALAPDGVLAVHVSNRYLDLEPIVAELARDGGLRGLVGRDLSGAVTREVAVTTSKWIVLARDTTAFGPLLGFPGWSRLQATGTVPLWTDDYTDVLAVVRWR